MERSILAAIAHSFSLRLRSDALGAIHHTPSMTESCKVGASDGRRGLQLKMTAERFLEEVFSSSVMRSIVSDKLEVFQSLLILLSAELNYFLDSY